MNEKSRFKIRFEQNENTKRAVEAMRITHKNGPFWHIGWFYWVDVDTRDVLFYFPINDFYKLSKENKEFFIEDLKRKWIDANFEILEHKVLSADEEYPYQLWHSLFFRLKSLI